MHTPVNKCGANVCARNVISSSKMSRTIFWLCCKVASPNLKGILRHMATVHAHDTNFHISCGVSGCSRTYTNFYLFKKHLYRHHRDSLEVSDPFTIASGDPGSGVVADESIWNFDDLPPERNTVSTQLERKKQIALFLLKAKEIRKVSLVALDGIEEDFTLILQETVRTLREEVNLCLRASGLSISVIDGLPSVFNNPSTLNPFNELESKYKQEKFYRENLNFLVSTCNLTHAHVHNIVHIHAS